MFLGTPSFAVPPLEAVARGCEVAGVVTRPDRPQGRGRQTGPSAVATAAERLGLRVLKLADVNADDSRATLAELRPDLLAVVAFGSILKPRLLELPRIGAVNLHGSLLPEYRGASPIQRALWDGRVATGVTTLWMDEGIDTGDLILQRWVAIEPADNAATLSERLSERGAPLLAESLSLAHAGRAGRCPQDRGAGSYAGRLEKRDGNVDWSRDAETVWCRQRAVTPWPGANAVFRGRRLTLVETWPQHRLATTEAPGTVLAVEAEGVTVACGGGALRVRRVKPEARAEMDAAAWARGARLQPGDLMDVEKEAHA